MSVVCHDEQVAFIIPARGGSKGIPGKNIKDFCGKSLIAWTIQACLDAKLGDVYVSSDSTNILKVAEHYGAKGILRPDEISGDTSSSEDAVIHALNTMAVMPTTTFFMQCTSPWINSEDIRLAYNKYRESKKHSLIFAKKNHNYFGNLYDAGYVPNSKTRKMRQEMATQVVEIGSYVFDTKLFLKMKNRQCGLQTAYVIDRELPPEIDSMLDWEINEKYFDIWRGVKKYENKH